MRKYCLSFFFVFSLSFSALAQDSAWLKILNDSLNVTGESGRVRGTFKATQIINTPTIEAPGKNGLQFLIMHRFGRINEGGYALFGLDNASIRFGLDYGINDRLSIGIGRSSLEKTYDASFKLKLLRQTENKFPVSVSLYELVTRTTLRFTDKPYFSGKYRNAYESALLIARKFSPKLSLQLTPVWLHYNLVPTPQDNNDVFAVGIGGRMKLTKRMSINAEYNILPSDQLVSTDIFHSLSLGIDLETGGHVFQLIFSNSEGMTGPYYLGKTTGSWGNGDIFFGFNISRAFHLKK
jgi:hypothetical protein